MTDVIVEGGWYGDSLPTGETITLVTDANGVPTHLEMQHRDSTIGPVRIEFFQRDRRYAPLFPRLREDGKAFAGQCHGTPSGTFDFQDRVIEAIAGAWTVRPEVAVGTSPVIYDLDGNLVVAQAGGPEGSGGYRYVAEDGRVVFGDETIAPTDDTPGLWQFTRLGRPDGGVLTVGQGADENTVQGGVLVYDGEHHRVLATGRCLAIRARRAGDQCSITYYRELGGQRYRCTHTFPTVAALLALPILEVALPPPPPPPVVRPDGPLGPPEPEGTWVNVADDFFALDDRCWSRGDKARGDTHGMDMQRVPELEQDGDTVIWYAKFDKDGKGRSGELISIDADPNGYIHWRADISNWQIIDLPSDTRWLRKRMQIGRRYGLDVGDHILRKVQHDGTLIREVGFNREMWLINLWRKYWINPWGECRLLHYAYNNTGQREGRGTGHHGLHVETYYMAVTTDGRVVGWGDWTYDPSTVVFASGSAVFPNPPTVHSNFWHLGGQRFPPDLPSFPMPRSIPSEVPSTMTLPVDVQATIRAFAARNPLPQGPADNESWQDTALRYLPNGWIARLAQTLAFFHGGNWGQKRRGPGAATSAGRIARREAGGFRDWDILIAAAGGRPTLTVDVDSEGLITDQEFLPVVPFNHLGDQKPRPGRALWPAAVKHGVSGFDVAPRVHGGDDSYYNLTAPLSLNCFVYTTIDHPATHRLGRTFAQGLVQTETLLKRLTADNRQAMFIMICGPHTVNNGPKPTRAEILDMVRQEVALFTRYPRAVLALKLGNELYQGFEPPELLDPTLWTEVEALIPLQFPFAIGQVGDAVVFGPGSVAMMHPDRGKSSLDALQILADAQLRDGRIVVAREPARIEAGGSGQSRGDIAFVREELDNAERLKLPYFLHPAAGRGAFVPAMDDVQKEALALIKAKAGTVVTPPPQGHPVLDVNLTAGGTFDAMSDAGYELIVLQPKYDALVVEAKAWHKRATGQEPNAETLRVMIDIRCVAERYRWVTPRVAWQNFLPAGTP